MRAKRSLGQNFLVGSHYPRRLVDSVAPRAGETIVEIGPGRGALTGLLLESGASVIAIELDPELIPGLSRMFSGLENFKLIEADADEALYEAECLAVLHRGHRGEGYYAAVLAEVRRLLDGSSPQRLLTAG